MQAKAEKMRIYECEHYEYEYDDWGKYAWCRSRDCLSRECFIESKCCQDLCPFYKKNAEGRYIDIELDDRYREIREECRAELKKQAEEALKEAVEASDCAKKKMEYARRLAAPRKETT
jgi:hypothetical protein